MYIPYEKENDRLRAGRFAGGRRRGSALVVALTAMVALGLLSAAVLSTSLMNLRYTTFLEETAVLRQTTVSLASSVAECLLRDYRQPFWSSMPEGTSREDEFVLEAKDSGLALPVRLRYAVTHRSPATWTVEARGEYVATGTRGADNIPAPWAISGDVSPRRARTVTWDPPIHAN